ncbi:hydantoin racemase [Xylaria bambusicola]|uniref:hydantoin racemase n=1 Tax=Xylaria bambusicola TaxID=326684 RepID=UPI00200886D7|nr:hydantoin racemase [Xylaria bambusicola]KAI0521961.1 hydantoin racemase [Xylaria bambusicola]
MSSTTLVRGQGTKILLLNPNSSSAMTDGMKTVLRDIDLPSSTEVYTYTGPSGCPASINDGHDIQQSTDAVLADFDAVGSYHGILVACFSVHPLVPKLQSVSGPHGAVTGIFEASVLAAITLLGPGQKWGIVTTGKFWEDHLSDGVKAFLGANPKDDNAKFAGVQSTGLNAGDFHHGIDPAVIREKLKKATKRLLDTGDIHVIVMGCAGMAGLEAIIREAAQEERDEEFAYSTLHVIDGVRAGVMQIDHMIRHQRLRPGKA